MWLEATIERHLPLRVSHGKLLDVDFVTPALIRCEREQPTIRRERRPSFVCRGLEDGIIPVRAVERERENVSAGLTTSYGTMRVFPSRVPLLGPVGTSFLSKSRSVPVLSAAISNS